MTHGLIVANHSLMVTIHWLVVMNGWVMFNIPTWFTMVLNLDQYRESIAIRSIVAIYERELETMPYKGCQW